MDPPTLASLVWFNYRIGISGHLSNTAGQIGNECEKGKNYSRNCTPRPVLSRSFSLL